LLVRRGLARDLREAGALIGSGRVLVDGQPGGKAGTLYSRDIGLELKAVNPFVSRGGQKLAAALDGFSLSPENRVCVDVGCSTGGFTDCLLQRGAARVYAVDVGYGVLDWTLRRDPRVVVLERCNARYLSRKEIPEPVDLCVVDASFISLTLLLEPLLKLFAGQARIVALVKPQFELPRHLVRRGGVVRDRELRHRVVREVENFAVGLGLICRGVIASPVKGARGNQEYLMFLTGTADEGSVDQGGEDDR